MDNDSRGSEDQVRRFYVAYQDWRAQVYGELGRLSADQLDTLGPLLRTDTRQLLDRIDAARERARRVQDDGAR